MTHGLKGRKQSPEHIAKRTAGLKGRKITWTEKLRISAIGRKASEETKKKMSDSHSGKRNHQFGKPVAREVKEKISKTRKELGIACGKNNPSYVDGSSFAPYCEKFNNRRKSAVRVFFGVCICCGCLPEENIGYIGKPKRLRQLLFSVHHIDHDKEQGCNGKPFNLVPMCKTCHNKENNRRDEYQKYINNTLREGFKWGVWNEEEYKLKVMYDE
jgi:hypothetical protein